MSIEREQRYIDDQNISENQVPLVIDTHKLMGVNDLHSDDADSNVQDTEEAKGTPMKPTIKLSNAAISDVSMGKQSNAGSDIFRNDYFQDVDVKQENDIVNEVELSPITL